MTHWTAYQSGKQHVEFLFAGTKESTHYDSMTVGSLLGSLIFIVVAADNFSANSLCERFAEVLGVEHFYTNFWLCLLHNPSVRLAGTSFLLNHIDKGKSMEDQLHFLGSSLSHLVRNLFSCLHWGIPWCLSCPSVPPSAYPQLPLGFPSAPTRLPLSSHSVSPQILLSAPLVPT